MRVLNASCEMYIYLNNQDKNRSFLNPVILRNAGRLCPVLGNNSVAWQIIMVTHSASW